MPTKIFKGIILLLGLFLFSFTNKEMAKESNLPMSLSIDKTIFIGPIILEKDGKKIELIFDLKSIKDPKTYSTILLNSTVPINSFSLAGNPIAGHKNLTKIEPNSDYPHAYEIKIQNFEIRNFNNAHYNYIYINTQIWEMNKKDKKGLNIIQ